MFCHVELMVILVVIAAERCLKQFFVGRRQNPDGSKKPIGKQDVVLLGWGWGEIMEHDLCFMRN